MKYLNRRAVKHADLNPAAKLFGGALLSWIDEEAGIYASCQLGTKRLVTKYMSEINFLSSAVLGDIVEIGIETVAVGRTSISLACEVRNKENKQGIIRVEKVVMVAVDAQGKPQAHDFSSEEG
ncbi:acyl-CoA thioesterase [Pseudoteredinibacter isoporae]|uniref:Acyl-CoA hydrolase n=1 Tax=Pseudoteredinibacter isoporae TaxID=570281 RepID=A0A7X0JPK2_9GAMM|nr:hotdog domain-containing protein [Pseudoteredinibacter isoporae]MBB6519942.1 acyl-CoA hydrolase [Pseudoteredinibacter isoporae]NHO85517.1 acyl-CoA thioesterase [Pseudoteredinibacter isoporae]NIB26031.1 acyl-CoA thioesterase [Pseudoteredinibacter isoporae]